MPITSEWLASACPDLEAHPGPSGLALRGRLSKSGDDYLLLGRLAGALETTCARCLEPARVPVDAQVAVTFVPADEGEEVGEDDGDIVGFAGNEIVLDDELRDEILLALPVQVLCAESCQGLCPVCGGNRNTVPCQCEAERRQSASQFAALGKLKI
ncbi:MAG TPA: DUF177 domain-containing protein [Polyangia bacterium]|nr:DUF177 domain-containing protein [Polyangia bacterium]